MKEVKKGNKKFIIIGIIAVIVVFALALNNTNDNTSTTSNVTDNNKEIASKQSEESKPESTPEPTAEPTESATPTPTEEELSDTKSESTNRFESGMYKVGTDMPAGEYVIYADNSFNGYMEITSSSAGEFDDIIANDNFAYNTIVTVKDGNYLTLTGAYAVPIDEAEIDTSGEGMFKVGIHIKAGEYKLECTNDISAYVEVSKDSTHDIDSIVSNDNFDKETYITVKDGQYLKLSGCRIKQ